MTELATPSQERRHYDTHGYVIFKQAIDPGLVQEAQHHVAWLQEQHPDLRPEQFGHWLVRDDPFWARLISDPRLLDIAEQFIGPNIALFASHYISKPPFDGKPVLWHQDGSYWPLDPMEVVTLWLAVDDATPENGCMQVIPGTQHSQLANMIDRPEIDSVLGSGMDDELVDESKAVDIVLKAGDVEVHHPNIIHGSRANLSPNRRCGLTIRYIPASTRITTPEHFSPYLLRGEAVPGVNTYVPYPAYVPGKHMPFAGCDTWS